VGLSQASKLGLIHVSHDLDQERRSPLSFYLLCWDIIQDDFMVVIEHFNNHSLN